MKPELLRSNNEEFPLVHTPLEPDEVNRLASNAFGLDIDMGSRVQDWHLVISTRMNNELCALGAYIFVDTIHGLIVYEDLKVVLKITQGCGIGSRITTDAIQSSLAQTQNNLYVLARTQNGQEFGSFKKGVRNAMDKDCPITPLETEATETQVNILVDFLKNHPPKRGDVDYHSFIHKGAYRTYPDMTAGIDAEVNDNIEAYLNKLGSTKIRGDAVYLLTPELINIG